MYSASIRSVQRVQNTLRSVKYIPKVKIQ